MSRQQPRSVTHATLALGGLVALSGLTALLTVVFQDELIRNWTRDHTDTPTIQPPEFVPVAIVLFVVFAALAGVLVMFVRDGHGWARLSLSALVVLVAIGILSGLRADLPVVFQVVAVCSVLVDAALLFFLWHRDTTSHVRGTSLGTRPGSTSS
jgi:hypothetical protein